MAGVLDVGDQTQLIMTDQSAIQMWIQDLFSVVLPLIMVVGKILAVITIHFGQLLMMSIML
jgi:hypothetical protein